MGSGRDAWIRTLPDFMEEPDVSWRLHAACADYTPPERDRLFFPAGDDSEEQHPERIERRYGAARRVCWGRCPVRLECLDYAMRVETSTLRYGMWGGFAPVERDRLGRGVAVMLPTIEAEAS